MSSTTWYELDQDAVIEAVESLGFLSDLRVFPLNSYENRVWQVGIEDETPIIAKFYRPNRWTTAQIEQELAFTEALRDSDVGVAAPLKINGKHLHQFKQFRFSLFERRGGHAPELDNFDHLDQLGISIAQIHNIGRNVDLSLRESIKDARRARWAIEEIKHGDWLAPEYRNNWLDSAQRIADAIDQSFELIRPDLTPTHGDCHVGNILWRDGKATFVDFDDCVNAPAIYDLWMFLSGDRADQTAQLDALVEQYEALCEFDRREIALITPMRAMRQLHQCGWLASRWDDPAFPMHFTWFNTPRYWGEQVNNLRQLEHELSLPSLSLMG